MGSTSPGYGTTVRIDLRRLVGAAADAPPDADEQAIPEGSNRETVLVVEDDADVRVSTVESLRELGYAVLEAADGPAALRLLRQRPDVDLLFTTGYARNAIVHRGRLDPGVQLLTKPFSFSDLAAKVRDLLDAPA